MLEDTGEETTFEVSPDDTAGQLLERACPHPAALWVKGAEVVEATALCDVDLSAGDTVCVRPTHGRTVDFLNDLDALDSVRDVKVVVVHGAQGDDVERCFLLNSPAEHAAPVRDATLRQAYVYVDSTALRLHVYSTATRTSYIRTPLPAALFVEAAVLMYTYDVRKPGSLDSLADVRKAAEAVQPCVVAVLVGDNMHSPARMLSRAAGAEAAERHGMLHIEVDSGTGQFIDEAFLMVWHQRASSSFPSFSTTFSPTGDRACCLRAQPVHEYRRGARDSACTNKPHATHTLCDVLKNDSFCCVRVSHVYTFPFSLSP